jgi:polysaccharide export outer membrane protein
MLTTIFFSITVLDMKNLSFATRIFSLCIISFIFLLTSLPCQAAESTADVVVDHILKEKLRQEFSGINKETDEEYTIGYRDILLVSIYNEGSMTAGAYSAGQSSTSQDSDFVRGRGTGIEVRTDGRISLRHIGDIYVTGMTLTQLADYLKKLYGSIYENPAVTVTLVQSNSRHYTIMGQVKAPGLYHLDFPITIVKAIAKSGGFTEWANFKVTVIRQQNSPENTPDEEIPKIEETEKKSSDNHLFKFDFDDFLVGKDIDKNIILTPNDVIIVH